jgi:hypothetical protein
LNHQQQPQPGQNPHQPQPGWGPQPPYGQPPFPPQPPKKRSAGKIAGFGCLGALGVLVLLGGIGAAIQGGSGSGKSSGAGDVKAAPTASASSSKPTAGSAPASAKPKPKAVATPKKTATAEPKPKAKVVTFKVWGTAPAGALGPLDITYGSDSDNRKGNFRNGTFTATLPLNDDAMYYDVSAQLQGSGDIQCSVTVDGKTKKGHASGDYNICSAQLSGGIFGGWE